VVRRAAHLVRAELQVPASHLLLVTVTRLVPQKALHVLLDSLARLPEHFEMAVVGEGRLADQLKGQAERLQISDRVRWLGWRKDIGDLIAAADVFALSSVWEAVALAAQESVQLGTPVVSTDVGGMSELITDGWSGRLVPAGDAEALASALAEVAGTPLGAEFAARASRTYEENFSRQRTLERLRVAYLRLAEKGRA
jgi:L-malate glycosyltransferase